MKFERLRKKKELKKKLTQYLVVSLCFGENFFNYVWVKTYYLTIFPYVILALENGILIVLHVHIYLNFFFLRL